MDSLNLSIPTQHDLNDPTVERDVARLRHWLTNLPLMDVVETVRLVNAALDALNEQKLAAAERFRHLEVYRDTAQRLFVTVDPVHLRQLTLGKSQRQEAIDGVEQLLQGIAGGYKLIVVELHQATGSAVPDPLLGLAINRSIEQLGYSLLDSYRFYRGPQPRLIAESHQLYRLARHHGLLGSVVDEPDEQGPPVSVAMHYHASMLLSLTDPYRLAEGEVGLLHEVLVQHASTCRVIPGSSWVGDGEGYFLLELDTDALPKPCSTLQQPVTVKDPYLLDATVALAAVRARLAKTPAKVRRQSPEAMVLRRLLPESQGRDLRREQRNSDDRWVSLLFGVDGIHAYLARDTRRASGQSARSVNGLDEVIACRVLDSSNSGMKLAWKGAAAGDARVGDLLGIIDEQGRGQALMLAVIRSVRVSRDGAAEAGVESMPGGLGAVTVFAAGQPAGAGVDALFMPASEAEQISATLVTAKGFYEQNRPMLIDVGGREVNARAGRLVLDSPVFDRFEFSAE